MAGFRGDFAVAAVLGGTLAAGCGGGSHHQASSSPAKPTARPELIAVLHAPGHRPRLMSPWPITVTLRWGGRPARGHISYQFLFAGQVVSRQQVRGEPAEFTGVFHDVIRWPATAVGYPLTLRIVVRSPHGTKRLDYPVEVTR